MKRYILVFFCAMFSHFVFGQTTQIQNAIEKMIENKDLKLGFAYYDFASGDSLTINGDQQFPMQSVCKLPISLAVLSEVDQQKLQLNQLIYIDATEMDTSTWSPLAQKYPQGNIQLPLSEIIRYTIAQSDNNGCDILLKLVGGPSRVQKYLNHWGINDISIKNTERELHSSWDIQFNNWATPIAMMQLLKMINNKELLQNSTQSFLWEVMTQSATGSIRSQLPEDAIVAYKTGTSSYNSEHISAATNCVGIMLRPNNNPIVFVIFITNSKESPQVNASIIADIAHLLYISH